MQVELAECVLIVLVSLALICHIIIFLRTEARICLRYAYSSMAAVGRCLRSWCRPTRKDGARSRFIADEVASQLVKNMRMVQSITRHAGAFVVVSRLPYLPSNMNLEAYRSAPYIFLGMWFISIILHTFPRLVNPKTMGFWYSVLMAGWSAVAMNYASGTLEDQLIFSKQFLACRLLLAWAYQRPSAVIFWNLVTSVLWELTTSGADLSKGGSFMVHELVAAAFVSLVSFAMYASTWIKADYMLQRLMLNEQVSAMTRLLNMVCDVTVELDSSLKVVLGLPALKALLTLDGGNTSTYDVTLQQYMPNDDDKQRYQDSLLSAGQDTGGLLPGALRLSMRDSLNGIMCIQVFYVHFRDPSGSSRYLVGLQEDTAPSSAPLRSHPNRHRPPSTTQHGGSSQQSMPSSGVAPDEPSSESFSSGSDTSSEGTSKSARRGRRLVPPYSRETSEWARGQTMLQMMERWSVHEKLPLECCQFHSTMKVLKSTMHKLKACNHNFSPFGVMQCTACGIVGDDEAADGDVAQECCLCCRGTMVRQSRKTTSI